MRGDYVRLIKTRPRYHCDFCSHTATEAAMRAHEPICWMNPNRYCPSCENRGFYPGEYLGDGLQMPNEPCYYCSKRTPLTEPVTGERSVPTKITDAHWIASGGIGDPTP